LGSATACVSPNPQRGRPPRPGSINWEARQSSLSLSACTTRWNTSTPARISGWRARIRTWNKGSKGPCDTISPPAIGSLRSLNLTGTAAEDQECRVLPAVKQSLQPVYSVPARFEFARDILVPMASEGTVRQPDEQATTCPCSCRSEYNLVGDAARHWLRHSPNELALKRIDGIGETSWRRS